MISGAKSTSFLKIELPGINYRKFNGREYSYAYATGSSGPRDFTNQLLKIDVQNASSKIWSDEGCYPGEVVFIAKPDADAENDGVVLSVVLNTKAGNSFLLILDTSTFAVVATAEVPHHIQFGLHGQHYDGKPQRT